MIITATPEPLAFPPRVRLDIDSGGEDFLTLTVLRDGRPIRTQPPVMGLGETYVYDYEAPFGRPTTYTAHGSTAGAWVVARDESWANLSGWSTESGTPAVSGGRMSTSDGTARITRTLPGTEGVAIRLTLPNRGSLSAEAPAGTGTFADASVGFGAVRLEHSRFGGFSMPGGANPPSRTFGLRIGADVFIPMNVADTGEVVLTLSADRQTVTVTHGDTIVERPVSVTSTQLVVEASRSSASVGPFTVEASSGAVPASASASTTLGVTSPWLIHPSQPSLSMPIEVDGIRAEASTDSERTFAARQTIYQPHGRSEAVMFPLGVRANGSWALVLTTQTLALRDDLLNLLSDQAPILLRSPRDKNWDLPDGWYAVGDLTVQRPVNIGDSPVRKTTLPLTRTAEPPVVVAPPLTWGDLMLRGYTWGDLRSKTWLQLLMGDL